MLVKSSSLFHFNLIDSMKNTSNKSIL